MKRRDHPCGGVVEKSRFAWDDGDVIIHGGAVKKVIVAINLEMTVRSDAPNEDVAQALEVKASPYHIKDFLNHIIDNVDIADCDIKVVDWEDVDHEV